MIGRIVLVTMGGQAFVVLYGGCLVDLAAVRAAWQGCGSTLAPIYRCDVYDCDGPDRGALPDARGVYMWTSTSASEFPSCVIALCCVARKDIPV